MVEPTVQWEAPETPAVDEQLLAALARLIGAARRLLVFTGAGASADSGVPTYRGGSGAAYRPSLSTDETRAGSVWDRFTPLTYRQFMAGEAERQLYWERSRQTWPVVRDARPNAGHEALAALQWRGILDCVVTQNIDGLHQAAGLPNDRVVELHGNAHEVRCLGCGAQAAGRSSRRALRRATSRRPAAPAAACSSRRQFCSASRCRRAGSPRPASAPASCDACLVIGSSLKVQPAASIPRYAVTQGARLAIVNLEPTWLDPRAEIVVHGRAAAILSAVDGAARRHDAGVSRFPSRRA